MSTPDPLDPDRLDAPRMPQFDDASALTLRAWVAEDASLYVWPDPKRERVVHRYVLAEVADALRTELADLKAARMFDREGDLQVQLSALLGERDALRAERDAALARAVPDGWKVEWFEIKPGHEACTFCIRWSKVPTLVPADTEDKQ